MSAVPQSQDDFSPRRAEALYKAIRDDFASRDKANGSGIIKLKLIHDDDRLYKPRYKTFEQCAWEEFGIETRQTATRYVAQAAGILGARKRFDDDSIYLKEGSVRDFKISVETGTSPEFESLLNSAEQAHKENPDRSVQWALDQAIADTKVANAEQKTVKLSKDQVRVENFAIKEEADRRLAQEQAENTILTDDEKANDELVGALRRALEAIRAAQDKGATMDGVIGAYSTEDRERWAQLLAVLDDLNEVISDGIELFGEDQRFVSPQAKAEWHQFMAERGSDDDSKTESEDQPEKAEANELKTKTPRKNK
jgi:hypothetical protein